MLNIAEYGLPSDTALVLLHGFCEDLNLWKSFVQHHSQQRVVAIDLPGFGQNQPLTSPITIDQMADQVYETINQQNYKKICLVGHSLGGYVALAFADKYPEMLLGVGLFHSTAYADRPEKQENRNKTIAFFEQHGLDPWVHGFVDTLFHPQAKVKVPFDVEYALQTAASTSVSTAIEVTKAMRDRPDRNHVLSNVNFPVMIIAGRNDNAIPIDDVAKQMQLPNQAYNLTLDNCGHMGMFEHYFATYHFVWSFYLGNIAV